MWGTYSEGSFNYSDKFCIILDSFFTTHTLRCSLTLSDCTFEYVTEERQKAEVTPHDHILVQDPYILKTWRHCWNLCWWTTALAWPVIHKKKDRLWEMHQVQSDTAHKAFDCSIINSWVVNKESNVVCCLIFSHKHSSSKKYPHKYRSWETSSPALAMLGMED